jgi:hypothetical protein
MLGWYAAQAIQNPSAWKGRAIPLAGDNISISEIQDAYARVQAFRPWKAWVPSFMINLLPQDFKLMLKVSYHRMILDMCNNCPIYSGSIRMDTKPTLPLYAPSTRI